MAKKAKPTKPLHLQPSRTNASNGSSLFGAKQSSDAWYDGQQSEEEKDGSSWLCLKKKLIKFHDKSKVISLKSLVKFWNDEGMNSLNNGGATFLPIDTAERLFDMAKIAMQMSDFFGAKVMILAAGLIHQARVTSMDDIVDYFVDKENIGTDDVNKFPFCFNSSAATASPDVMQKYLDELDIEYVKAKLALAEPLIDIAFGHSGSDNETTLRINSLISLNSTLSEYAKMATNVEISKNIVRVKHNGRRLFLRSSGKESLSDLGFVNNDVIEIEGSSVNSFSSCTDVTNVVDSGEGHSGYVTVSKRSKRKGKKKGKKGRK